MSYTVIKGIDNTYPFQSAIDKAIDGVLATLSSSLSGISIATYDGAKTYAIGDCATYNDVLYKSSTASNIGNQPDVTTAAVESLYLLSDVPAPTFVDPGNWTLGCHFTMTKTCTLTHIRLYHVAGVTGQQCYVWHVNAAKSAATFLTAAINPLSGSGTSQWVDVAISPALTLFAGQTYTVATQSNGNRYGEQPPPYAATTLFQPALINSSSGGYSVGFTWPTTTLNTGIDCSFYISPVLSYASNANWDVILNGSNALASTVSAAIENNTIVRRDATGAVQGSNIVTMAVDIATDKATLAAATANATNSTVAKRGASAECAFGALTATSVTSSGTITSPNISSMSASVTSMLSTLGLATSSATTGTLALRGSSSECAFGPLTATSLAASGTVTGSNITTLTSDTAASKATLTAATSLATPLTLALRNISGDIVFAQVTCSKLRNNTDVVFEAMPSIGNIKIGQLAGVSMTGGTNNIAIGLLSQNALSGFFLSNVAVGSFAMQNSTGINYCAAVGESAMINATGSYNNAFGRYSLPSATGQYNCAFGDDALHSSATGDDNVGMGATALWSLSSGARNVGVGRNVGVTLTTGSNCTLLGYQADVASAALTNATALGNGATVAASNAIQLGNSSVTAVNTSGVVSCGGVESASGVTTLSLGSTSTPTTVNLGTGSAVTALNIGTGVATTAITIGGANDTTTFGGLGIKLPSSGGTATALNFYEEYLHHPQLQAAAPGTYCDFYITRIGRFVQMTQTAPVTLTTNGGTAFSMQTQGSLIPSRFVPVTPVTGTFAWNDASNQYQGTVCINSANQIELFSGIFGTVWPISTSVTIKGITISWQIA